MSIALVGKYTDLKDSYMSVIKALEHSALSINRKLTVEVRGFLIKPLTLSDSLLSGWSQATLSQKNKKRSRGNITKHGGL